MVKDNVSDNSIAPLAIPMQVTESQQAILDQLHNHAAFSDQLILLSGPQGAGKSSILEVFLEQASDYANLAFLPQPDRMRADAIRRQLLRQLVQLDKYAADDSLTEALQRNIQPGRQHLIIVIDDALSLPPEILTELNELTASRHLFNPEHRVSVILAGGPEWAKRVRKGIALGEQEAPATIEVGPFTKREQSWFAKRLLQTQPRPVDEQKVREVLTLHEGYPGEIQAALQELVAPPPRERRYQDDSTTTDRSPAPVAPWWSFAHNKVISIVAVAALCSLAITLYLHRDALFTAEPEISATSEAETPAPPAADTTSIEPASEPADAEPVDDEPPVGPLAMGYDEALQKLNRASQDAAPGGSLRFQLVKPLRQLSDESADNAEPESEPEPEPEVIVPPNPWLARYDNARLWQADPTQSVLQIAAYSSQERITPLVADFPDEQTLIYHTLRDGRDWYVILIGPFADADAARAHLAQSPPALQNLQPWVKSMQAVQRELAPVLAANTDETAE
ncbi:AAA family ATPase [Aliidiomarina sp. Khilg15.8]